jgi:sterol 24-C-methyltransferase
MLSYYDFATLAFEINWQSFRFMPFSPAYPPSSSTIATNLLFYHHSLALRLGLRPGTRVLDAGSGIDGPARNIARFIGCEIVSITINQGQVDREIFLARTEGSSERCTFV